MEIFIIKVYITEKAYEHEGDIGYFRSFCPYGNEVLTFKYNVIKLWELDGLELLKENILGLYPSMESALAPIK